MTILNSRSSVFEEVMMPAEPSFLRSTERVIFTCSSAPKPSWTVSSFCAAAIWPRPTKVPSR